MPNVIMTRGLPGSGKSTWARQQMEKNPGAYKRVNKDDLRAMLDDGRWSKANESFVLNVRDYLIRAALEDGKHVIVDDTNFAPKHQDRIRQLVRPYGAQVIVQDFDTPLEECIKRDLARPNSVGEKVIRQMYDQFLAPAPEPPEYIEGGRHAIIVDLDGTLAIMGDRSPYDAANAHLDTINPVVRDIASRYMTPESDVILLSGRQSEHRAVTEQWLHDYDVEYHVLWMRPTGDTRKDSIVKRELFDQHIRGNWNIDFVLDDRDQVVQMWRRELGLTCLQVAEGNF